jgi:tRNA-2-methylthio-N6-dimethylallyladenosine synthase
MFKFSPRPGTNAVLFKEDYVEKETIDTRFMKLKNLQTEISKKRYQRFIGTDQYLLVEKYSKKSNNFMSGKIDGGQTTHINANDVKIGDFIKVRIVEATPFALKAIIL